MVSIKGVGILTKKSILKLLFIPSSGAGEQNWLLQTQRFPDSEAISLPVIPTASRFKALRNMPFGCMNTSPRIERYYRKK